MSIQEEEVQEPIAFQAQNNMVTSYLDTSYALVQILQSTGWNYNEETKKWVKGDLAILNKTGFLELRRILFSVLHPGNQLSFMRQEQIEEEILGIMKSIIIQFAMNMISYDIPNVETLHTLMAQIRVNLHFHLMKSSGGNMLNALTQQISTIYSIQGDMGKSPSVGGGIWDKILGKKKGGEKGGPVSAI